MSVCLFTFESHVTLISLYYFELVSSDLTGDLLEICVLQPNKTFVDIFVGSEGFNLMDPSNKRNLLLGMQETFRWFIKERNVLMAA